ncbi:MAG: LysM peptidoglycan-binding domain-containing protein [Candidatus Micrarchaeia archaeon]|jgi:LysM repeat protein
MKNAGVLFVFSLLFAIALFAQSAQALCICQGGPQSAACKQCGSPASTAAAVSYTVKAGQLLTDIAKECGVDVGTIQSANALSEGAVLQAGQVLQIPGGKCGSASAGGGCEKGNQIVAKAKAHTGQLPGAFNCPSPGCACFASRVYQEAGISFGYSAWAPAVFDMAKARGTVIDKYSALQPGDLTFYQNTYGSFAPGTITHVEIYVGGGSTIGSGDVPVKIHPAGYFGNKFYRGVRIAKC